MGQVSHITPDGSGGYWGWDDQAEDWVPVDPKAFEGSTIGNLGRAAQRGFSDIGLGIEQLTGAATPAQIEERRQASQAQGAAAAAGAPMAEMLGQTAPDALAGILAGAATGGAGLPAMLAASALSGAGTAAIRPGSVEERLNAALWGAVSGAGGEALGQAAFKGIGLALQLGKGIVNRGAETTARAVETGAQRAASRQAMSAADDALTPSGGPRPGMSAADDLATPSGGSTAGAAQVVDAETEALAREGNVVEDAANWIERGTGDNKADEIYQPAEAYGFKRSNAAGAPRGSRAWVNEAVDQFNPFSSTLEEGRKVGNQQLLNRAYARAAGMTDNIGDEAYNQISIGNFAELHGRLSEGFQQVEQKMRPVPASALQEALDRLPDRKGYAEPTRAEKVLNDVKDNIRADLAKNSKAVQDPQGFIGDLRRIQQAAVQAAKDGDHESAQRLSQAVEEYYKIAERVTERSGSLRDREVVASGWKELRDQYRMYMMGMSPGVWGNDGTINGSAMFRKMKAMPINGGWGSKGPPQGSKARALWDIAQASAHETTALGRTPATGVRLSGNLAKIARNTAAQTVGAGIAGAAGVTALKSLWD